MAQLKKILVVDDEAGIRSLLYDVLSSEGFEVTLAEDGEESLDRMKGRRFDLLITDIQMPGLDGIELLKRMKKAGRRERVIVMTGKTLDRDDLGKDMPEVLTMMEKPIQVGSFLSVVESALAQPSGKGRKGRGQGGD